MNQQDWHDMLDYGHDAAFGPRRSGRTMFLVNELVKSVVDGQPYSCVVAVTERHAQQLRSIVADRLRAAGLKVDELRSIPASQRCNLLQVEGSLIWFMGRSRAMRNPPGFFRNAGWFWDHAALEQPANTYTPADMRGDAEARKQAAVDDENALLMRIRARRDECQ